MLTSTDVGLPLGPEGTAALLPAAIEKFTKGLERPAGEVMVFLAAREAAHQRLFAHVPWLRQRLLATVEEYAAGHPGGHLAHRGDGPADRPDRTRPSIEEAMSSGLFEPQTTPEQQAALERLETLLALIEGWVDVVVAEAVGDRLPGADALRETLRRRRASGGPAEQTFATLVGLELRPRRLRAAAELWRVLGDRRGIDGRDARLGAPGPAAHRGGPGRPGRRSPRPVTRTWIRSARSNARPARNGPSSDASSDDSDASTEDAADPGAPGTRRARSTLTSPPRTRNARTPDPPATLVAQLGGSSPSVPTSPSPAAADSPSR